MPAGADMEMASTPPTARAGGPEGTFGSKGENGANINCWQDRHT